MERICQLENIVENLNMLMKFNDLRSRKKSKKITGSRFSSEQLLKKNLLVNEKKIEWYSSIDIAPKFKEIKSNIDSWLKNYVLS